MDYLREGIHLRGFAQIEPLVAYKNEAFELFQDLMNSVWGDFARMIFHVEVTVEGDEGGCAATPAGTPPAESQFQLLDRWPRQASPTQAAAQQSGCDGHGRRCRRRGRRGLRGGR